MRCSHGRQIVRGTAGITTRQVNGDLLIDAGGLTEDQRIRKQLWQTAHPLTTAKGQSPAGPQSMQRSTAGPLTDDTCSTNSGFVHLF